MIIPRLVVPQGSWVKLDGLLGFLLNREERKGSVLIWFYWLVWGFFFSKINVARWKEDRVAVLLLNCLLVLVAYLTFANYPLASFHRTSE